MQKKLVIIGIITAAIIIASVTIMQANRNTKKETINALYECTGDDWINASFDLASDKVIILLSDGRQLMLPRAISASGARYANADESLVFWNKGDSAFIDENGTITYQDCMTNSRE